MTEQLENLVRQWGRRGDAPAPPGPPTGSCLTYAQAEAIARGQVPPGPATQRHIDGCGYCAALLADFGEALAEAAPAAAASVRLLRPARLAAAAAVLVAAGVALLVWATRERPAGPILAAADVALESDLHPGLTPKGPPGFTSGQTIVFRVTLARDGHVAMASLDARGDPRPVPVGPGRALSRRLPKGPATLGPYRLDDNTGPEAWFVIVTERSPGDVEDRVDKLKGPYHPVRDREKLAELIRSWPAEVKVISFEHVEPPARP